MRAKRIAAFTPYFTEDEANQVRAAFLAAGHLEGDASVSDFIVRATMREVKRLQRKHNQGRRGIRPRRVPSGADNAPGTNSSTGPRTGNHDQTHRRR